MNTQKERPGEPTVMCSVIGAPLAAAARYR